MLDNLLNLSLLLSTAVIWGVTNVFIKQGSTGITAVKADSKLRQILLEIRYLILNWKVKTFVYKTKIMFLILSCYLQYLLPFFINQGGSVLFVYALQKNNLSVAVLVTNSLTLLFTSVTSIVVERKVISYRTYLGALLISLGSSICVISSQKQ